MTGSSLNTTGGGAAPVLAAVAGGAMWLLLGWLCGEPEAWDDGRYFLVGLPALTLACGGLGWLAAGRSLAIGLGAACGQFAAMLATSGFGNLWPLGLALLLAFSAPAAAAAWLGAWLRRRAAPAGRNDGG